MQKKKIIRLIFIGVAAIMLLLLFAGRYGLINLYQRVYRPLAAQRTELTQLRRLSDSLQQEKRRLETDTAYIERIAREKLGMARKDETIFKFVDENKK
jgi:cell division protein FtsB